MGTKRVLDDICWSQSSEERLMREAQDISPQSEGEELIEPESPEHSFPYSMWWARLLRKHARAEGLGSRMKAGESLEPIRLVSACSGCCAEAAALKAGWVGIDW